MPPSRSQRTPALRAWWRVTKTLQPGEPGTVRLFRLYGEQLVCVRYRTSGSGEERLTTVELVLDRTVIRKRGNQIVAFKIRDHETRLQRKALALGAWFDEATGLWNLARHDVLRLGLRHRIAVPRDQMLRDEMARNSNELLRMAK
jgi:hypothetical protein